MSMSQKWGKSNNPIEYQFYKEIPKNNGLFTRLYGWNKFPY